jgi:hypothetical protein
MNKRSIIYLMSGPAHLPYLVVSLRSLRQNWDGPIVVYAWPKSFSIVQEIAKDNRLDIEARSRIPSYRGKNSQFVDKISLMRDRS